LSRMTGCTTQKRHCAATWRTRVSAMLELGLIFSHNKQKLLDMISRS
jgi:hypothetical protein